MMAPLGRSSLLFLMPSRLGPTSPFILKSSSVCRPILLIFPVSTISPSPSLFCISPCITSALGYEVIRPLDRSDRVFKPYVPFFFVVQIGSHQLKVSNRDCIFMERLKFCEVNDKIILNKVLLLGSPAQTIVGRPVVPDAAVHTVVEEHALDAKVIIFKKKRRKNYRRTRGHRQELTKLRITDIQGIEKPEIPEAKKPLKVTVKPENVAVPA